MLRDSRDVAAGALAVVLIYAGWVTLGFPGVLFIVALMWWVSNDCV